MSEPETVVAAAATSPPISCGPAQLRLGVGDLPKAFHAVACALGEAGVGGQQLPGVFATGLRATCTGCGMTVTGAELSELMVASGEDAEHRRPSKLERLHLGYCPRNGCEARYSTLELSKAGQFEPKSVLDRAGALLAGDSKSKLEVQPAATPETRRATRRIALIALATLFVAFVAYRFVFYRSQLIPFVEPTSPFMVDPGSLAPPR
jgi:hypothetical protein